MNSNSYVHFFEKEVKLWQLMMLSVVKRCIYIQMYWRKLIWICRTKMSSMIWQNFLRYLVTQRESEFLYVLFESEACVCDIATALNMNQSAISHQLRILKQNRLVSCRRDGKSVIYSLADEHVRLIIGQGRDHLEEENK